ncbi:hypothetical protein BJ742DRAFT_808118 [Cladochytrium replicatum]|nr:hypothetical protein BJ742DRAFT_808118 [Cladochytrium replicatum]
MFTVGVMGVRRWHVVNFVIISAVLAYTVASLYGFKSWVRCEDDGILQGRNSASFWSISSSSDASAVVIKPTDTFLAAAACNSLASAVFRVNALLEKTNVILVRSPNPDIAGTYTFILPPAKYAQDTRMVTIEARLEFGYWPVDTEIRHCSGPVCNPDSVFASGIVYNGSEVRSSHGKRTTLRLVSSNSPSPTALCNMGSKLVVEVDRADGTPYFTSEERAQACRLRDFGDVVPSDGTIHWIHVIGDSNCRHMVPAWAKAMNLATCHVHTAEDSVRPTTSVCFNTSGQSNKVLSFSWFFLSYPADDTQVLSAIELSSLANFIASVPFPESTVWPGPTFGFNTQMSALFLSLGSHAPLLTYRGVHERLDKVHDQLRLKFQQARKSFLLSTLAVEETMIPERWGNQSSVRNNVMIDIQNKAAKDWIAQRFPSVQTVDLFTYSRAIHSSLRQDAVHFQIQVYTFLAQIAWTAEATKSTASYP